MQTILSAEHHPSHRREGQRKFIPDETCAETIRWLEEAKETSMPIEQYYLSLPDEPFSLRIRRIGSGAFALLETREPTGRTVIETEISTGAAKHYQREVTTISKQRHEIAAGALIDWFTPPTSELPEARLPLIELWHPDASPPASLSNLNLQEVTDNPRYQNEAIAHNLSRQRAELIRSSAQEVPSAPDVATDIVNELRKRKNSKPYVLGIRGRSGSGKTTLAYQVKANLSEFGTNAVIVSTDDYHRGKRWLLDTFGVEEWTNWDADVVYNTDLLAFELQQHLEHGEPMPQRRFDFATEEPAQLTEGHAKAPVVIVEGLYPHAEALQPLLDRRIDMHTPLATSIGRRILRDMGSRLNNSLGSAESILRYQLETAEPTYQRAQPDA